MGVSRDFPDFSSRPYPLLSQERVKLRTSIWQVYSPGPSEQKPRKNLGEKGAWVYPVFAQIFGVPPIISGTRKATELPILYARS